MLIKISNQLWVNSDHVEAIVAEKLGSKDVASIRINDDSYIVSLRDENDNINNLVRRIVKAINSREDVK